MNQRLKHTTNKQNQNENVINCNYINNNNNNNNNNKHTVGTRMCSVCLLINKRKINNEPNTTTIIQQPKENK